MTDPARLSDQEDAGGSLLRSARADAPTDGARRRAAIALGLAVGATAAGTTATVTAAAAPASKLGGLGGVALLVKWIGVGAVGSAMAIGTVKYVAPRLLAPTTRAVTSAAPAGLAAAQTHASPPRSGVEAPPSAALESAPSASASPEAPPIASAPAPIAAPTPARRAVSRPGDSLADEVRALDRAATALAAGDARRALDALDAHDREFKGGALSQEADVIRIDALAASGDDSRASARARAFLARFPDGAQANHVRSVLDAIESKTDKP